MRVVPLEERTGMTTSRRKADLRSKRSQEKLSDALLVLLKKKKIDKISVKEIAKEANISPLTFYNHFKNKLDLLDYCFYSNIEPVMARIPDLIKGAGDQREALERIVRAFVHFVFDNLEILAYFVRNDASRTIYWAMTKLVHTIFKDVRTKNGHLFHFSDLPDEITDTFFAGGLTYLIYELIRNKATYSEEEATQYFVRLIYSKPIKEE